MLGNLEHGLIIFLFAMYLVYYNDRINNKEGSSGLKLLTKFWYFLLLLSISSIYCGLLYNEFMSILLSKQKTCYEYDLKNQDFQKKKMDVIFLWVWNLNDL